MSNSHLAWTLIEKYATDSGFDLAGAEIDGWRTFESSQVNLRIWLKQSPSAPVLATSSGKLLEELQAFGGQWDGLLPPGAQAALMLNDSQQLYTLLRKAFQLSRLHPEAALQSYLRKTAALPNSTEAERWVVQRIGQGIFREQLFEYWNGRCAITGLSVPELLRASHIKPWAACESDSQRLDVYNGLLLAAHLDAAFDQGLISVDFDGGVLVSAFLDEDSKLILGLEGRLQVSKLHASHHPYLHYHHRIVFKSGLMVEEG